MEPIIWDPSFLVGVEVIDTQHREIVRTINRLLSLPASDLDSVVVSEVLTRLVQYATDHFTTEEALLEKHGYAELPAQRADHKQFRRQLAHYCDAAIQESHALPADLLPFIKRWWIDHILGSDRAFGPFLNERGVF